MRQAWRDFVHVRWRGGSLHGVATSVFCCDFCLAELVVVLPAGVRELAGAGKAFLKTHRRCKPPPGPTRHQLDRWESDGGA